ncbi:MAG: hypothetical protein IPJ13_02570 [Saprospiraceae bacterium]|nr:hypothetical protein [Saprospiraceae bacterium]
MAVFWSFVSASGILFSSGTVNLGANGYMIFWLLVWTLGGHDEIIIKNVPN